MTKLLRAGLVALLGFAVATPAALASKVVATPEKGHMTVKDDAHVFDKDSVIKAESKFHGITFKHHDAGADAEATARLLIKATEQPLPGGGQLSFSMDEFTRKFRVGIKEVSPVAARTSF